MKTPREILEFVGYSAAAERLGVSYTRVDRAAREDKLPAVWYHTLENMAGRPLPRDAFHWKGAA